MKRKIFVGVGIIAVIALIIGILYHNKQELNQENQLIDRSDIPVTVTAFKVQTAPFDAEIQLPAKLNPVETAVLSAQVAGRIQSLNVDFGSSVIKGEKLGEIDVRVQKLNLKSTLLLEAKLEKDYHRVKALYEGKAASEEQYIAAKYNYDNSVVQTELIRQQIQDAALISPIDGIVTNRELQAGEFAGAGKLIASIVNNTQLKATVYLDETEVYSVKKNQSVEVSSPVFPERQARGRVSYISPEGDDNYNYQVDVLFDNSTQLFKAGTNVNVLFKLDHKDNTIMIPGKALVNDRKDSYVYVIENGRVHSRKIITGLIKGENIEVTHGLSAGEEIVLSGQINLDEGTKVNVVKR